VSPKLIDCHTYTSVWRRLIAVTTVLLCPVCMANGDEMTVSKLARELQKPRAPIGESISAVRSAPGVTRSNGLPSAQGGTSPTRHSIYFPIKVGAAVGCGTGATLAYFISPYVGGPGPQTAGDVRQSAMIKSCVVGGLLGAGIGYLIATH
jgi:hypothetical protein